MSKEQFIQDYIKESNLSTDEQINYFTKEFIVLPCNCGDNCKGWAVVSNNPLSIKAHNLLYNN